MEPGQGVEIVTPRMQSGTERARSRAGASPRFGGVLLPCAQRVHMMNPPRRAGGLPAKMPPGRTGGREKVPAGLFLFSFFCFVAR